MTNHPSVQKRIDSLKAGIELYSGKKVTDIKVHEDPKVSYTFAIRVTLKGRKEPVDMLIVGQNLSTSISKATPETIADNLEECDFKEWPPVSGKLRFF